MADSGVPMRSMRYLILAAILLSVVLPAPAGNLVVAPNQPAPLVKGFDVQGTYRAVDWSAAKLTVINFWATWCEPCRKEMPRLQQLLDERAEGELQIVGIAKDTKLAPELIGSTVARLGVSYPVLVDGRRISREWGGTGIIPTTYIIDAEGIVVRRYVGGSEEQVAAMLKDIGDFLEGRKLGPPLMLRPKDKNSTS